MVSDSGSPHDLHAILSMLSCKIPEEGCDYKLVARIPLPRLTPLGGGDHDGSTIQNWSSSSVSHRQDDRIREEHLGGAHQARIPS
jgi:hypothetical protein